MPVRLQQLLVQEPEPEPEPEQHSQQLSRTVAFEYQVQYDS